MASSVRWVSEAVMTTDQTMFHPLVQGEARSAIGSTPLKPPAGLRGDVRRLEHLANFALPFPHHLEEPLRPFDGLLLRLHLDDRVAGDQFFGFGEGSVGDGKLPAVNSDTRA